MDIGNGLLKSLTKGRKGGFLALLVALLLLAACSSSKKADDEQRREIHGLKAEIAQLKEKLAKLEADQQGIWDLVKRPAGGPESATQMEPAPDAPPLTVSQLIAGKDRLIGTRVRVKGLVGPVLVHHKSLLLKSPEGLVEVFFGNLEEKLVQRLTSTLLDQPVTVIGMVSPAPKGGAKLMITAEGVEF